MKKAALMLCCLGLLLFALNPVMAGPIKLKVYGKGGIVQTPDGITKVCPITSTMVCTEVLIQTEIETPSFEGLKGILVYNGQSYKVEIVKVEILYKEGEDYYGHGLVVRGVIQ